MTEKLYLARSDVEIISIGGSHSENAASDTHIQ